MLPRTVYVNQDVNSTMNYVAAFSMSDVGALLELSGSPYSTGGYTDGYGGDATDIAVHRGTRRLFATNNTSVAIFDIDPVTGELTAVTGSPFALGGSAAYGIVVNDAGDRIFVANCSSGDVSVLDVDEDGVATPVSGSPFGAPGSGCPDTPQLLHDEALLTVTDESENLYVYTVDSSTGALAEVSGSPFDTTADEWSSRRDPSGTWLYLPDTSDGMMYSFEFDYSTGAASQITGSPFATSASSNSLNGFAFTPDGAYMYAGNYNYNEFYAFSVGTAGELASLAGSPYEIADLSTATSLEVTRDGAFLVITHEGEDAISVFEIGAAGVPSAVTGSPFTCGIEDASGVAIGE